MLSSEKRAGLRAKLYAVTFFVVVLILAVMPLFFYWSKVTKNPKEFSESKKRFCNVEVRVKDISPELAQLIKVGDVQRDYNGDENTRIISIPKIEPQAMGKVVVNNGTTLDVISDKKDMYIIMRLRYDTVGYNMVVHPSAAKILIGSMLAFESSDYCIYGEILKIETAE